MAAGKKKGDEKEKEPRIDFEKISKDIANMDHRQHIDQIGPSVTDVYIKHAKYTDDKGVTRYRKKFSKKDAENLVDDIYNALAYHSHRRVFGIDQKSYENLEKLKDEQGNPYVDLITQVHYNLSREGLKKVLAQDEQDNPIDHNILEKILEEPVQHHAKALTKGLISKHGLNDPKHMDAVKEFIENSVDKYHLNKKRYNTKKMHSMEDVISAFLSLAHEKYKD